MVFPNATEEMKVLLKSHEALTSKRRKWNKDVLSVCLTLWVHIPKTYQTLQDSNMLILPSGRQLRRYKNIIPQHSGLNQEVLYWMYQAAQEANLPNHGRAGGLHHDETRVQEDIFLDMGMFKNNEAFHFFASHACICQNVTEQTKLKDVFQSLCSSYKILF